MDERRLKLSKKPSLGPTRKEPIAKSDGSARPGLTGAPTYFFSEDCPTGTQNSGKSKPTTAEIPKQNLDRPQARFFISSAP